MTKKCPFSSKECMGEECALWDDAGPRSGCSFIPRNQREEHSAHLAVDAGDYLRICRSDPRTMMVMDNGMGINANNE
jgi:hypothetical protein